MCIPYAYSSVYMHSRHLHYGICVFQSDFQIPAQAALSSMEYLHSRYMFYGIQAFQIPALW